MRATFQRIKESANSMHWMFLVFFIIPSLALRWFGSVPRVTISKMKQAHLSFNKTKMKMKNQFSIRFSFFVVSPTYCILYSSLLWSRSLFILFLLFSYVFALILSMVRECVYTLAQVRRNPTQEHHAMAFGDHWKRVWERERAIIKESGRKSNTYTFTVGVSYSRCLKQAHSKCNIRPWPHTPWMEIESINLSSKYLANKFNNFNCFHSWCRPHQCEADMDGKKVWAAEKT